MNKAMNTAPAQPKTLTEVKPPIDDMDRFSLTPSGYAALNECAALAASGPEKAEGCPECATLLSAINLYHGGRGYVAYDACMNCGFRRRT